MSRLLSVLGLAFGAAAAFAPALPSLIPRLGVGLYRLLDRRRHVRQGLAAGAWLMAVAGYRRRPSKLRFAGVAMTTLLAGLSQILNPKRVFVALDRPPHVPAPQAELGDDALVLGAEVNGEACAWPFETLVPRHLINDRIGGRPVLAAY